MPCRSGWSWHKTDVAARITVAAIDAAARIIVFPSFVSLAGLLAKRPVNQFFHELHALELQKLSIRFFMPIQNHAHLPRSRKYFGILDQSLVVEALGTARRVP